MDFPDGALYFPHPSEATPEGLVAIGGDLSVARLKLAYRSGIFPWYEEGQPLLWWSPDPRMVLFPDNLRISKSLRKTIRKEIFTVTLNQQFSEVVDRCANALRPGQEGTWITPQMKQAYAALHQEGMAVSVEVWKENQLVGGLYGVDLAEKKVFCGESMFATISDASKVGFCYLVSSLRAKGYALIDCQVYTPHLERFGAEEIAREAFLAYLR